MLLTLGVSILGCGGENAPVTAPRAGLESAARPGGELSNAEANFEKRYMTDAVDRAELTRRMAEICMEKEGLRPELDTFCSETAADAAQHGATLQSYLMSWYEIQYDPVLSGPDQRLLQNLAALLGSEFETKYLETMVKHYTTSVRKEQQCYGRAGTTALIAFCFNVQFEHSQALAQMDQWLCDWYGDCPR